MQSFRASEFQKGVLKTIVYADIFDYPLTFREVLRFLINDTEVASSLVQKQLRILADSKQILRVFSGQVCTDGEFYFLKGRGKIVELRKERTEWSKDKWEIAQRTANKLKIIPTIKMIGVTGALAMNNCDEADDIDILIITSSDSLWLTRLLIIVLCSLAGIQRRKPGDKNVKNKICFNLFLEEGHLRIEPESLFLAHEIVQVKPVYDKDGVYKRFLWENRWVRKFLPNAKISSKFKVQSSKLQFKIKSFFLYFLNLVAFYLQYLYMKPKITNEKIGLHQAFFHPIDLQERVQKLFENEMVLVGLDKNKKTA